MPLEDTFVGASRQSSKRVLSSESTLEYFCQTFPEVLLGLKRALHKCLIASNYVLCEQLRLNMLLWKTLMLISAFTELH